MRIRTPVMIDHHGIIFDSNGAVLIKTDLQMDTEQRYVGEAIVSAINAMADMRCDMTGGVKKLCQTISQDTHRIRGAEDEYHAAMWGHTLATRLEAVLEHFRFES